MSQKKEPKTKQEDFISSEIKKIIENITKEYGEGTITTLGKSKLKEQKVLSTGSLLLDQAIGTGGYVCGKIVEIYGLESSGKSTLSLHAVRECQKLQKYKIGSHALLMSQGLKILKSELTNKDTIIIFINQIRNKISTGYYGGNPETTTGGMALRFDSDLRIKLKRTGKIEKNDKLIGIEVEALIKKSKIGAPEKTAKLEIIFTHGIQKEREIIDLAAELNIIQKSGT